VKPRVYVLGGIQTDFARNWSREGKGLFDAFSDTVHAALEEVRIPPESIDVAHVGNFTAELFCRQGHLGGFFAAAHPAFSGIPASRHEAACASGSIALLAAASEIEAGRYGLAAIVGVEQMRNVPGEKAAEYIGGPAMWSGNECVGVRFPWPHIFSQLGDEYEQRYGLRQEHLARIAEINFANAKRNPNAQTRRWVFSELSFTEDDEANPVIDGRIRKQDCGQITDGAAVVFLASPERAAEYARKRGLTIEELPYIKGWGHHTGPICYQA
jgi:acetyl-CoA C-acetyltransferase